VRHQGHSNKVVATAVAHRNSDTSCSYYCCFKSTCISGRPAAWSCLMASWQWLLLMLIAFA